MDIGDSPEIARRVLKDADTALEDKDPALRDVDKATEDTDTALRDSDADEADTPELVTAGVVVFTEDTSGCAAETTIELAGIDGMIVGDRMKELLVKVGTAMLIGTDEDVFAYGAATELARTELGATEVKLVKLVTAGTDVFNCVNEVVVDSGRVTGLLAKKELIEIELFVETDLIEVELLVATELVGMELPFTTGTDVLKCAEPVTELLVVETNTVVLVKFSRGTDVIIDGAAVLLVVMEVVGLELLLGRMLLEMFNIGDESVITGLDVVSGAAVGVQDAADTESVTVLSYTEVTSLDKIWVEY
jgi:hypothetical protein